MLRKSFAIGPVLISFLLFAFSVPALADVKVEWDTTTGWNNATADISWATGFTMNGDWSLGSDMAFFLKDSLSISKTAQEWQGTLDRCYLRYEQGPVRLNVGRQSVIWGIGWFFRPTDLITPITPLDEEMNRPGKDLALLRWSTTPLTATDFIAGDRIFAVRSEWRIGSTNLRLLGIGQSDFVNAVGFDFQGGLAGLYGEGAFQWAVSDAVDQGRFAGLVGWRKTLRSGSQLSIEYFRNDLSKAGPVLAGLLAQNRNRELVYANQNYLAAGLQIPWDQLTTYSITGISNLDDGGVMITGTAAWQITDNIDLKGTLMTVFGPEGTEFDSGAGVSAQVELKYYF